MEPKSETSSSVGNIARGKNDTTEAGFFQARPEKAEFFGQDNNDGKIEEAAKKEEDQMSSLLAWIESMREAISMSLEVLSRAVVIRTVGQHSPEAGRSQSQLHGL